MCTPGSHTTAAMASTRVITARGPAGRSPLSAPSSSTGLWPSDKKCESGLQLQGLGLRVWALCLLSCTGCKFVIMQLHTHCMALLCVLLSSRTIPFDSATGALKQNCLLLMLHIKQTCGMGLCLKDKIMPAHHFSRCRAGVDCAEDVAYRFVMQCC